MLTVTILKGLPASGKSTWAKNLVNSKPNMYKRINKDDLRAMLDNSHFSKPNERFVLKVRDILIKEALLEGKHVIVDDTNLHPKHEEVIRELVLSLDDIVKAEVQVRTFYDVSVDECIARDLTRQCSVGERVIREMNARYLMEVDERVAPPTFQNKNLPNAIIVDVDGTIARMIGRGPFDWTKVGEDEPIEEVVELVNLVKDSGVQPIFVTARDGVSFADTRQWIHLHVGIPLDDIILFSRAVNDMRKDCIVKKEIFDNNIKDKYYIKFVLDDRNQVVEMWRSMGLRCLQVAPGNF